MAVENKYINPSRANGDKTDPVRTGGGKIITISERFEVSEADDNGSIYRAFSIPSNAIPLPNGSVMHDSITAGSDYEFGLYDKGVDGAEVDKDVFLGSTSFADTTPQDPFALANTVDNIGKPIWELLGLTEDSKTEYDWAITANTVGSADGTIAVFAQFLVQH